MRTQPVLMLDLLCCLGCSVRNVGLMKLHNLSLLLFRGVSCQVELCLLWHSPPEGCSVFPAADTQLLLQERGQSWGSSKLLSA